MNTVLTHELLSIHLKLLAYICALINIKTVSKHAPTPEHIILPILIILLTLLASIMNTLRKHADTSESHRIPLILLILLFVILTVNVPSDAALCFVAVISKVLSNGVIPVLILEQADLPSQSNRRTFVAVILVFVHPPTS